MSWIIDQAMELSKTDSRALDRDLLMSRLLHLNMVAVHTTSMVMSNVLMDLYTSSHKEEFVAGLREECERVLAEHGGKWTKDAVNKLYRIDSTLRESLRHQVLGEVNVRRMVISRYIAARKGSPANYLLDPKGISLSDGLHIPQGITVVAPVHAIHTDESIYQNATEWNAFRFSQPWEDHLARLTTGSAASRDRIYQQSFTAFGEDYLSFGYGRHACPGRFFASQELKLMLAHVVMNYDIKIEGPRPANLSMNASRVPKDDVTMQVRLRR